MSDVVINVDSLTYDEYREGLREAELEIKSTFVPLLVRTLLGVAGAWLLKAAIGHMTLLHAFLIAGVVGLAMSAPEMWERRQVERARYKQYVKSYPMTCTLTASGLRTENAGAVCEYQWSSFESVIEGKSTRLFLTASQRVIIPKRLIVDERAFRALMPSLLGRMLAFQSA